MFWKFVCSSCTGCRQAVSSMQPGRRSWRHVHWTWCVDANRPVTNDSIRLALTAMTLHSACLPTVLSCFPIYSAVIATCPICLYAHRDNACRGPLRAHIPPSTWQRRASGYMTYKSIDRVAPSQTRINTMLLLERDVTSYIILNILVQIYVTTWNVACYRHHYYYEAYYYYY